MMHHASKHLCLAVAAVLCCGCRTDSHVVEQRDDVRSVGVVAVESADTVARRDVTVEIEEKTSHVVSDESGRVEIERDTVGRPVAIVWQRTLGIASGERVRGLLGHCLDDIRVSGASAVSRSVDTHSQRLEDKKTEIATPHIEGWISAVCLAGVALCLLYVFFVDCFLPWIKTRLSR